MARGLVKLHRIANMQSGVPRTRTVQVNSAVAFLLSRLGCFDSVLGVSLRDADAIRWSQPPAPALSRITLY